MNDQNQEPPPQDSAEEEVHPPHCVEDHPVHCCHFIVTERLPSIKRGHVLVGYKCLDCKKHSKAKVEIKGSMTWFD